MSYVHYSSEHFCEKNLHLKNFNIDYLKNNVLLVRPLWLSHVKIKITQYKQFK